MVVPRDGPTPVCTLSGGQHTRPRRSCPAGRTPRASWWHTSPAGRRPRGPANLGPAGSSSRSAGLPRPVDRQHVGRGTLPERARHPNVASERRRRRAARPLGRSRWPQLGELLGPGRPPRGPGACSSSTPVHAPVVFMDVRSRRPAEPGRVAVRGAYEPECRWPAVPDPCRSPGRRHPRTCGAFSSWCTGWMRNAVAEVSAYRSGQRTLATAVSAAARMSCSPRDGASAPGPCGMPWRPTRGGAVKALRMIRRTAVGTADNDDPHRCASDRPAMSASCPAVRESAGQASSDWAAGN